VVSRPVSIFLRVLTGFFCPLSARSRQRVQNPPRNQVRQDFRPSAFHGSAKDRGNLEWFLEAGARIPKIRFDRHIVRRRRRGQRSVFTAASNPEPVKGSTKESASPVK